jgi:hypothetical protein
MAAGPHSEHTAHYAGCLFKPSQSFNLADRPKIVAKIRKIARKYTSAATERPTVVANDPDALKGILKQGSIIGPARRRNWRQILF